MKECLQPSKPQPLNTKVNGISVVDVFSAAVFWSVIHSSDLLVILAPNYLMHISYSLWRISLIHVDTKTGRERIVYLCSICIYCDLSMTLSKLCSLLGVFSVLMKIMKSWNFKSKYISSLHLHKKGTTTSWSCKCYSVLCVESSIWIMAIFKLVGNMANIKMRVQPGINWM